MTPVTISYKVKVQKAQDGTEFFRPKTKLTKHDCTSSLASVPNSNSDIFPKILQRAHRAALGLPSWAPTSYWVRLSELPDGVTLTRSGFLSVVTVEVNV